MEEALMPHHVVRQGETLARIAERRRLAPDDIWNADDNRALVEARGANGHILRPGDVLWIPDAAQADPVSLDVQTTNDFEAVVPRVPLSLRIVHNGEAAAGEPFIATAGAWRDEGSTTAEGRVEIEVPVIAETVDLHLPSLALRYAVQLGALDPAEDLSGLQDRLHALGLYGGPSHGQLDEATRRALSAFQQEHELPETGEPDEATANAVTQDFGC
jgi:Putative peptidoglycan binding domain/LysM domain